MEERTQRGAKLLHPEQHVSCNHYKSDYTSRFKYLKLSTMDIFPPLNTCDNHILFIREGKIVINCGCFKNREFVAGDIILLPSFIANNITIMEYSRIIISSFDVPIESCDKLLIDKCCSLITPEEYDFLPLRIKDTMGSFIDLIIIYLEDKINCEHLHELKQKEMFFNFKWYYSDKEQAILFHNLSIATYEFKRTILENYQNVSNTNEMAQLLSMSRRKFEIKFKEMFADTYANWVLKHISNKIAYKAVEPGVTVNDLMACGNFSSPTAFNRFCQKYFGCTPGKLIENKGAVKQ
ncbi:helix-turn-helix domain-containing protein [Bacteroides hominis]|uniref:helix-turn-helix domain-containing protein n=1 Tax=Bacteroides thetaiotaomicron TaxID=818 RepID=UPI0022751AD7|nr:helix-turn-helix domain-containing protein [Bacteroides fragilis]